MHVQPHFDYGVSYGGTATKLLALSYKVALRELWACLLPV